MREHLPRALQERAGLVNAFLIVVLPRASENNRVRCRACETFLSFAIEHILFLFDEHVWETPSRFVAALTKREPNIYFYNVIKACARSYAPEPPAKSMIVHDAGREGGGDQAAGGRNILEG